MEKFGPALESGDLMVASKKLTELTFDGFDDLPNPSVQKEASLLLSAILRFEHDFKIGISHVVVERFDKAKDEIEVNYDWDLENVKVGVVRIGLCQMPLDSNPLKSLLEVGHSALLAVLSANGINKSDLESLGASVSRLIHNGRCAPITLKFCEVASDKYKVSPFVKLVGTSYINQTELYLLLQELSSGKTWTLLIAQDQLALITDLCIGIKITKNCIVLRSKRTFLVDDYSRRGFRLPVTIPIEHFFQREEQH